VKLGQGRENGKDFLRDHPEIANEIEGVIRSHVAEAAELAKNGLRPAADAEDEEPDAVSIAESIVEEAESEE
jgi:recombination protein RecA